MKKSSRTTEQPLYDMVRTGMLEKLRTGEWAPGAKIPTESQLAEQFSVSIGTVRKAVEDLVAERVLLRRARIGTTVALHTDEHAFGTFFNFTSLTGQPVRATAELLSFRYVAADALLARQLQLAPGAELIRIDNLRRCEGAVAMFDRVWVSRQRFAAFDKAAFLNRAGSIYGLYQSMFGITVVRIQEELAAVMSPAFVMTALELPAPMSLLKIQRKALSYGSEVVEYRERYVNTAVCQYQNEVGLRE